MSLGLSAWMAREDLRADVPLRQRACGRMRYVTDPIIRGNESGAYWDGVLRCRSKMCPVCFLARRVSLLHEVRHVVKAQSQATHQQPLLATLTIRHQHDSPIVITRQVRDCWRRFVQGRWWVDFKTELGGCEWICAEEITRGENGWHPHIHVALMPTRDPRDMLDVASRWYERWAEIVVKKMGAEYGPLPDIGTDLRKGAAIDYVGKLAWELSDAGAVKGSTPIALIERGLKREYVELQTFRKGARDVTWSRGLRTFRDDFASLAMPATQEMAVVRGSEYERLASKGWQALYTITEATSPEHVRSKLAFYGFRAKAIGPDECAALTAGDAAFRR